MSDDKLILKLTNIFSYFGIDGNLSRFADDDYTYHLNFENRDDDYNLCVCLDGLYVVKSSFMVCVFDDVYYDSDLQTICFTLNGLLSGGLYLNDNSL